MLFWNPHIALGRPFLADVDSVVFYPPSATCVFPEVHLACALGIGLHLFLGLYIPATEPEQAFAGQAEITRFEAKRMSLRVTSPRAAILVLAEPWFPYWEAQVNGRPAECFPANAWMRAVLVPAGSIDVVFTYRSTYFALGAGISLATFALLMLLVLRPPRGTSTAVKES